jgi:hypothetical protein
MPMDNVRRYHYTYCKDLFYINWIHRVLSLLYTECPISSGQHENSGIWQDMEKCKEGKVVANHVFSISSVGISYLGRAVTALHSLHYQQ